MGKLILHHLDILNEEYCTGWCFNRLLPLNPVTLQFYLDDHMIAQTECSTFREDVCKANLRHNGNCGFVVRFPRKLDLSAGKKLKIRSKYGLNTIEIICAKDIQRISQHPRPVIFMHIPKTAGTSFNNHVQSWFGFNKWHIHLEVKNESVCKKLVTPGNYLAGHFPLGKIRQFVGEIQGVDLYSIVRNPVNQLHSHLAWIKGIGSDTNDNFYIAHSPVVKQLAMQLQSNVLDSASQIQKFVNELDGFQIDFFDNLQTRYFLDYRPNRVSQKDLDIALDNLNLFKEIGTTDLYPQFLALCAARFRGRVNPAMTRHNPSRVANIYDTRDSEIQQSFSPLIQYDLQLYEAIRAKTHTGVSPD